MSLSDKLTSASKISNARLCKIGVILISDALPASDKETLKTVLGESELSPNRVSNTVIAKILREEGFDVSNSAVDRHRREDCPCSKVNK